MALRLRGATSGYIELKAPASAGDNTLTLPTNNGSANQLLKTDGSGNLSWVDDNSGVSLSGSTNNTIATVTGANALAGEANFTFDGDTAAITRSANTAAGLSISNTNNSQASAIAQLELSGGDNAHGRLQFECNGIYNTIRSDGSGNLKFFKGSDERLNISSVGDIAIGGCAVNTFNNYQTLTIGGARAVDGVGIDLEKSDGTIYGRLFADGNGLQIGAPAADDYIRFETQSTERVRITSGGNISITDGDLVIGTSGHGIDFSATSDSGGMANELLDDYEEGTFTPTMAGNTGSLTLSTAVGNYTKVGNVVYFSYVVISSSGTTGTFPRLGGLPFTSSSTAQKTFIEARDKVGVSYSNNAYSDMYFRMDQNATTCVGIAEKIDGSTHTGSVLDFAGTLRGSGFYFAA